MDDKATSAWWMITSILLALLLFGDLWRIEILLDNHATRLRRLERESHEKRSGTVRVVDSLDEDTRLDTEWSPSGNLAGFARSNPALTIETILQHVTPKSSYRDVVPKSSYRGRRSVESWNTKKEDSRVTQEAHSTQVPFHRPSRRRDLNAESLAAQIARHLGFTVLRECYTKTRICIPGPRGLPGRPGHMGIRGKTGKRGKRGTRGANGVKGQKGDLGNRGVKGSRGYKGNNGERGAKGSRGDKGAAGDPGHKGSKGDRGELGPRGESGRSFSLPVAMVTPSLVTVNASETSVFHCSASGLPQPTIHWTTVKGSVPGQSTRLLLGDGRLEIRNTTLNDSGLYECRASNVLGVSTAHARLVVTVPPAVSLHSGPTYVQEGSNVMLPTCHVTGFPHPQVKWSKAAGKIPRSRIVTSEGQLSILKVLPRDSGDYFCRASNYRGTAVERTQLVVFSLPRFTVRPPQVVKATEGSSVSLQCKARGHPVPVTSWERKDSSLPVERSHQNSGELILRNLELSDSGTYICTATSAGLFEDQVTSRLVVLANGCWSLYKSHVWNSEVHTIDPDGRGEFPVFCDMMDRVGNNGGWTLVQRRLNGAVNFSRDWRQYEAGFGQLDGEFWLGNDKLHRLTTRRPMRLRIDMRDNKNKTVHVLLYNSFSVGNASSMYRLTLSGFSGTGEDLISHLNGSVFVSRYPHTNCSILDQGGWWSNYFCPHESINSRYIRPGTDMGQLSYVVEQIDGNDTLNGGSSRSAGQRQSRGILLRGKYVTFTEMRIRPASPDGRK